MMHVLAGAAGAEVVALAEQDLVEVLAGQDEVVAGVGDDQVDALAAATTSSPAPARISSSPNWSVMMSLPSPPKMKSLPSPPSSRSLPPSPHKRVVAFAADEDVVAVGAAEHDVLGAGELQLVGVAVSSRSVRMTCAALKRAEERISPLVGPVGIVAPRPPLNCFVWSTSRKKSGVREDVAGQMRRVGVAMDQLGELVVLELGVRFRLARRDR